MPWPASTVDSLAAASLFDSAKIQSKYDDYVRLILRPQWTSSVEALTTLIDFRDFAEDTLTDMRTIMKSQTVMPLTLEALVKSLKTSTVPDRKLLTVAFLTENALCLRSTTTLESAPSSLIVFVVESEIESFNSKAREICKYRPVLSAPRVTVERIASEMDTKEQTYDTFKKHALDLGTTSLWPVYALFKAVECGEMEDLFLHAPLPRVFGSPSCVRNGIERKTNPAKLCVGVPKPLSLEKCVLSAKGRLAWRVGSSWVVSSAKHTGLIATLPGIPYVWTMDPETMGCGIYKVGHGLAVEFDLPKDAECPNWIDCQRDPEGALVLMWGRINALTGSLGTQNACAFDEDALVQNQTLEFLDAFVPLKARRVPGARVDWRDHGNLLSVHHTVEDSSGARKWVHTFEVVFGNNLLMTLTTDLRPIEAIYGCPTDMILLSPLSSKALQHWKLEAGAYIMASCEEVPPGRWTSLAVA